MTCNCRPGSRGVTLIEILVASALFGMFTGMVATALIMAHRTQESSAVKLDAIRRASLCLNLLVRDIEAARYVSDVTMNGATPPAAPGLTPVGVDELQVARLRKHPSFGLPYVTQAVTVGYWYDQGSGELGKGMVRRVLYDPNSGPPMDVFPGEDTDGRIIVRDVIDFKASSYVQGGLTFIKADIWVTSLGKDRQGRPIQGPPISTSVALEPTLPP